MKWMRILMMMTITAAAALGGAGCEKGAGEKAGKAVDNAMEKTGEKLKDAADSADRAVKDAADDLKKKVN